MKNSILKEIIESIEKIPEETYNDFINEIKSHSRIFVWGLGRSGMVGKAFAMRLRHLGKESFFIGEVCPPIDTNDLLIIVSKTGKPGMLLPPIKAAKKTKACTLCITAEKNHLTQLCKKSFILNIPNSIQFGGCLFEQTVFIFFDEVVERYRKKEGISFMDMEKNHANWE